ncbi:MAG TPA: hypothetical protein VIU61_19500 [Kofleriaceae bacterium]
MRWAILLVLLVGNADADDDGLDIPGLDSSRLRGDALVWEDAAFYFEPWDGGTALRFTTISRRTTEVGRAVPVRIVDASMRGFVEIAMLRRSDCTWRRLDADARLDAVRLFVKREDLAPVLAKPYSVQHTDGTKVKLAPGLPVVPTASGHYAIGVLGDRLRLAIPHASVGYLYKGATVEVAAPGAKLVRVDRNTIARLGEQSFTVRGNWLAPPPVQKSDPARVSYATRCLELVAQVPVPAVRPGSDFTRAHAEAVVPVARPTRHAIPRGAPLTTVTGRAVAVAAQELPVSDPGTGNACLDFTFQLVREDESYATQTRQQRLCAAREVVITTTD